MSEVTGEEKVIAELVRLNAQVEAENSWQHTFVRGIIHGIGFFLGSVVIATISLGLLSPWFGKISWIKTSYERGVELSK
jgi:hypothetical protein